MKYLIASFKTFLREAFNFKCIRGKNICKKLKNAILIKIIISVIMFIHFLSGRELLFPIWKYNRKRECFYDKTVQIIVSDDDRSVRRWGFLGHPIMITMDVWMIILSIMIRIKADWFLSMVFLTIKITTSKSWTDNNKTMNKMSDNNKRQGGAATATATRQTNFFW